MNETNFVLDAPENFSTARFGGFWERFAAAFIDGILLWVVQFALYAVAGVSMFAGGGFDEDPESAVAAAGTVLMLQAVSIAIGWLYFAYFESSEKQATIGKQALGLKVTNMRGERISFLNATGRHFAKFISAIILLIGYLMQPFTEKKQALHDIIASTLVVKK